ncbi:ESCRT-II complex, vps25 subunit [Lophium mytilinum]|uniref:Vacuolar protein-sorting-associated protein 25 n=1 Tax=Lophium mytilinum TaxID=390894 RepID=A0A6A6QV11_9PEZI|nr:ESCRT-II complex, vps25 subunit [Lophium mytilinum]
MTSFASSNTTLAPSVAPSTSSSTTPSPTDPTAFAYPALYNYPPFFTLQPILPTRHSQLLSWSLLIQAYTRHHALFSLSLIDALSTPLFHNRPLHRRLSLRDARAVIDYMCSKDGDMRAEWITTPSTASNVLKKSNPSGGDEEGGGRFWVFWRKPDEWANLIESWVDSTGQKGVVLTLYELAEGDATRGQEFHGMEAELLSRCLGVSVKRGRAQVFGAEGGEGVKFF